MKSQTQKNLRNRKECSSEGTQMAIAFAGYAYGLSFLPHTTAEIGSCDEVILEGPCHILGASQIELVSWLHHSHVVHLMGFCTENQGKHTERLLIYENMPKGNLRERLNEATTENLDWGIRVFIALEAAKGLEYLHEAAAPKIMHRDIKSTNI
ncbi:hypothetical protein AgCh_031875 [Apium graveolens]